MGKNDGQRKKLHPKKIAVICILRVCNWRKIAQVDKVTKFAIALIIFKVKINFVLRLKKYFSLSRIFVEGIIKKTGKDRVEQILQRFIERIGHGVR